MKKIWYLKDIKSDNNKAVKIFLYEKNGVIAGKLDLSAFRSDCKDRDIVLEFQGEKGREIGKAELYRQMPAREACLLGKGQLREELAKLLADEKGEIQLSVTVGEKIFLSDGWIGRTPKEEKKLQGETDSAGENRREGESREKEGWDQKSRERESRERYAEPQKEIFQISEEPEREEELEAEELLPEESVGKRFVQLAALEEELEFRKYLHNSFLLHGYYNYGHVVIDESGENARLGVPGNYYKREQMVAEMFGFPNFEPAKEKEQVVNGTFGYYFTVEN